MVNIAANDLGASAAKKYDLEAWLPGQEPLPRAHLVLEHHRLPGAPPGRAPPPRGGRVPAPVHTLNGTAVAVGRTIIAIAENHQGDDGTVTVPEVLHPFGAPATI